MVIPYTPSQVELQVRVASWTASSTSTSASSTVDPQVSTRSIGSKGSIHVELSRTTSTMKDDPPNKVQSDRLDQSIAITTKQIESGTDVATDHLLSPVSVLSDSQLKQVDIGALESSATTITATTTFPTETTNNPDTLPPPLPPLVHLESRSFATPGYNLAGVHLLLFLVAEASLLVLLTTLFLGVLIMTEYVLDREDENEAKARWYFWGRIVGVVMATVVGAVHGSFLSACVLLDGQSDCIAKAVVGTIFLYWVGMIAIMNRTTGPLPY
ncbi:hypothetical protein BGX33_007930 [Mortierella sp. NVP41]|nr:hypothetical protein BGX33_007930 [Mortierella sp. NVP41]